MNETIDYYNHNAGSFAEQTVAVDFKKIQDKFLQRLKPGGCVLDFGCGSGRDTKYFLAHGFQVDAIDGAEELVKFASAYTGISVKRMPFEELCEAEKYDGIWACASILHLPKSGLRDVLPKLAAALKKQGIIYVSFKYGEYEGVRNGRFFTDFTIETFRDFIENTELCIEEWWISYDARPDRREEKWLNLILKKPDTA